MYKNYIAGQWVEAQTSATFASYNPANGELIGEVPQCGPADVETAVTGALKAFERWRHVPAPKRGEILFRVAQRLETEKERLAQLMTREMGKVIAEARGDVQEAIDMAYFMAGEGRRLLGYTAPVELPNKFGMAVRDPVGVVACITPWNFPIAIPSWKILPALIAGNAVIFKPASDTPILGIEFVRIFEEAGLPPGVLSVITGPGEAVGEPLISHPDVRVISFTGSTDAGRRVSALAAPGLKKVSLELGGKNAITVLDDADVDLALDGIIWSAFGTAGQRCTACSRLIVQRGIYDTLVGQLAERTAALRLGDGLEETTDVGPVINRRALQRIHSYVEIGRNEGARVRVGGCPVTEGAFDRGSFYQPTLLENVTPNMRVAQEEIFGPVLSIIKVADLAEAIAVNNATPYGLSSAIFTQDVNAAFTAMRELTTGIVYINAGTIGAEIHFPFGGTRGTGNGHREAGQAGIDTFTEWKSVYVDFSGRLQRAQIDTDAIVKEL
jgi:acyl-CoA reductase-like NAD-dependent aldehyde dehydrogenase